MSEPTSKFPLIAPDATPSAQEVFDAAATWLLSQDEPCMREVLPQDEDDNGSEYCCYRSEDGRNACAVGIFMPDAFARRVDDRGELAVGDIVSDYEDCPRWFGTHLQLLSALQGVHDGHAPRPAALTAVAKTYGLRPASPTKEA